jgi:hypothetical protein
MLMNLAQISLNLPTGNGRTKRRKTTLVLGLALAETVNPDRAASTCKTRALIGYDLALVCLLI